MADTFNAYHVWLGIPPNEQPPNHYRLLGITMFETDLDVIEHAGDRQMAHVRTFQSGRHGSVSQQLLNELAAARLCLLSPDKKVAYDQQLKAGSSLKVTPLPVMAVPVASVIPTAVPTVKPPMAKMVPQAAPVVKPQHAARPPRNVSNDDDGAGLDLDTLAGGLATGGPLPSQIRVKRRKYSQTSNWQGAAGMGLLMGIVVISIFLLYLFLGPILKQVDWQQLFFGVPNTGGAPTARPSDAAPGHTAPPKPLPSTPEQP